MIPRLRCWLFGHDIDENDVKQYCDSSVVTQFGYAEWILFNHRCKKCNQYVHWEKRCLRKSIVEIEGKNYHSEDWVKYSESW